MADPTLIGAIGAALAAGGGAVASILSAARAPGDAAAVKADVAKFVDALAVLRKRVEEVAATIDPDLRRHLDALVDRVAALEEWRARLRASRSDAPPPSRSSVTNEGVGDHERRLAALEARAEIAAETLTEIRVSIAGIVASVDHLLERRRGGGRGGER